MIKASIISVIVMLLSGYVHACIDERDMYSAGVLFNNNERINSTKIETIGKSNVNYFKNCTIAQPVTNAKPISILTPEIKPGLYNDAFDIESLSVQGNTLILKVVYAGGCKTHDFDMYASSAIGESFPPVLFLTVSHNANNDMCKALLRETINFDLSNLVNLVSGYFSVNLSIQIPKGDGSYNSKNVAWYLPNSCTVKYRSHNAPEMLVTLEYVSHQITKELFPSLRLTSDPSIQTLVPIDYTKAVVAELKWLTETGIVQNFNSDKINLISDKLKGSGNWYWTKQDSSISYNGVFTYKRDDSGGLNWDNVVYMDSRKNGCGSYSDFALPPESLNASSVTTVSRGHYIPDALSIIADRQNIHIQQNTFSVRTAEFQLVHLSGRVVYKKSVIFSESGKALLPINGLHSGMYTVIVNESGKHLVRKIVIP
jgi:hypothetical protein